MSRRIGCLGGTFDPIHMGHLIIAEQAYDQFDLDQVLLIPSGHSYLKDSRAQKVQPPEVRLKMTQLAASCHECFAASDIEIKRSGNTYTYETFRQMHEEDPEAEIFFIVGADTICSIRTWREPAEIFRQCTILAAGRADQISDQAMLEEIEALIRDFGADIRPLQVPAIGISSTDIRERAAQGRSIRYLVPEPVKRYIIETGIYNKNDA